MAGPSAKVARIGSAASLRAQGKVLAIQAELLPPTKTKKDLAYWLLAEELAVEKTLQGRDVATFEVVMEAAGLATYGQLEGLGHLLVRRLYLLRRLGRDGHLQQW